MKLGNSWSLTASRLAVTEVGSVNSAHEAIHYRARKVQWFCSKYNRLAGIWRGGGYMAAQESGDLLVSFAFTEGGANGP